MILGRLLPFVWLQNLKGLSSSFTIRQVYINALGLLLRICVRGHFNFVEDQLMALASCLTDEVSSVIVTSISCVSCSSM